MVDARWFGFAILNEERDWKRVDREREWVKKENKGVGFLVFTITGPQSCSRYCPI